MEKIFYKSNKDFIEIIRPFIYEAAETFKEYYDPVVLMTEVVCQLLSTLMKYMELFDSHYKTTSHMIDILSHISKTGEFRFLFNKENCQANAPLISQLNPDVNQSLLLEAGGTLYYYYNCRESSRHRREYNRKVTKSWNRLLDIQNEKAKSAECFSARDKSLPVLIKTELDKYVYGQEEAKKILSMGAASFIKSGVRIPIMVIGPTGCGKSFMMQILSEIDFLRDDLYVHYYSSKEMTENGYVGDNLKDIFQEIKQKSKGRKVIFFLDEIDKLLVYGSADRNGNDVNKNIIFELLSAISGNNSNYCIDTNDIWFVFAGAFDPLYENRNHYRSPIGFSQSSSNNPNDLRKELADIGCSHQFIGRIGRIALMEALDRSALRKVFTNEPNGLLPKKRADLSMWGVSLEWSDSYIEAAIDEVSASNQGARYVTSIIEKSIGTYDYQICESGKSSLYLDKNVLFGGSPIIS